MYAYKLIKIKIKIHLDNLGSVFVGPEDDSRESKHVAQM